MKMPVTATTAQIAEKLCTKRGHHIVQLDGTAPDKPGEVLCLYCGAPLQDIRAAGE